MGCEASRKYLRDCLQASLLLKALSLRGSRRICGIRLPAACQPWCHLVLFRGTARPGEPGLRLGLSTWCSSPLGARLNVPSEGPSPSQQSHSLKMQITTWTTGLYRHLPWPSPGPGKWESTLSPTCSAALLGQLGRRCWCSQALVYSRRSLLLTARFTPRIQRSLPTNRIRSIYLGMGGAVRCRVGGPTPASSLA